jgi:Ran-binding protein 1
MADFSDGVATKELFAIRFANTENAEKFKKAFEKGQDINSGKLIPETETKVEKVFFVFLIVG